MSEDDFYKWLLLEKNITKFQFHNLNISMKSALSSEYKESSSKVIFVNR